MDRSLGKNIIADVLRSAGVQVEIHDNHFPTDAPDEDWLSKVGRMGWVILTKDKKIRYRTIERDALIKANARVFMLTAGEISAPQMAEIFVKALPDMHKLIAEYEPPFIAKIYKDGSVTLWHQADPEN